MNKEKSIPKHYEIAIDLAQKIKHKQILEGAKLRGRSLSATEYNTSSETIRKAFKLLSDHGVVQVQEKVGVFVISREASISFLHEIKVNDTFKTSIQKLDDLILERARIDKDIKQAVRNIKSKANRVKDELPVEYFVVLIEKTDFANKKTIEELDIFNQTQATLFGVQMQNGVMSTIDRTYVLHENDVLYLSGDFDCSIKTVDLLKNGIK